MAHKPGLIGTVWRDTYDDKTRRNLRTIRLLRPIEDDRWEAEVLTRNDGLPDHVGRKTRVSTKTLRTGYERMTDAGTPMMSPLASLRATVRQLDAVKVCINDPECRAVTERKIEEARSVLRAAGIDPDGGA